MSIPFTWIYLIRDNDTGFHKIGKSNNPHRRLSDLTRQSTLLPKPHDFEIVEAWHAPQWREAYLHRMLDKFRVRGEWFDITRGFITIIQSEMAFYPRLTTNESDHESGYEVEEAEGVPYAEMLFLMMQDSTPEEVDAVRRNLIFF